MFDCCDCLTREAQLGPNEPGLTLYRVTGMGKVFLGSWMGRRRKMPVLATAFLRLQFPFRREARGEIAFHAPEPGEAGFGCKTGGLEAVELYSLLNRIEGNGRD
jgi:hypothetical protein